MNNPNSSNEKQTIENRQTTTVACLTNQPLIDGCTVTTLCGQHIQVHIGLNNDATESGDYIVCPLCEAAQLLADVQIPHLEQGELFS
jgi:hypothetical protein